MSVPRIGPLTVDDPEYCKRDIEFDISYMSIQGNGQKRFFDPKIHTCNVSCAEMRNLATDLSILNYMEHPEKTCVLYIGTSNMKHLPALASLFPATQFHVYHPCSTKASNIKYRGQIFDQKAVAEWKQFAMGNAVIMISDVRVMKECGEAEVISSMQTQATWLREVKPMTWAVSFRIPIWFMRNDKLFEYLPGSLRYMPYSREMSPELRLVGNYQDTISPMVMYRARDIEQFMMYHNTVIRPNKMLFANVLHEPPTTDKYSDDTFDNGYDSSYFLTVVKWYTWRKDAIARPKEEASIVAFAKRLMASMFW